MTGDKLQDLAVSRGKLSAAVEAALSTVERKLNGELLSTLTTNNFTFNGFSCH